MTIHDFKGQFISRQDTDQTCNGNSILDIGRDENLQIQIP